MKVAIWYQNAGVTNNLTVRFVAIRHDRLAAGHRLNNGKAEPF